MPSYPCRWPTCTAYVPHYGYCPDHQQHQRKARREIHRYYDQHNRNDESKKFYNSSAWKRARGIQLAAHPVCRRCTREWSTTVHHIIPLDECTPEQRVDQDNLFACCASCHSEIEAEVKRTKGQVIE
jgi:5-methylcytosine-specific restriction protein A